MMCIMEKDRARVVLVEGIADFILAVVFGVFIHFGWFGTAAAWAFWIWLRQK